MMLEAMDGKSMNLEQASMWTNCAQFFRSDLPIQSGL